jgi:hypothetical protein
MEPKNSIVDIYVNNSEFISGHSFILTPNAAGAQVLHAIDNDTGDRQRISYQRLSEAYVVTGTDPSAALLDHGNFEKRYLRTQRVYKQLGSVAVSGSKSEMAVSSKVADPTDPESYYHRPLVAAARTPNTKSTEQKQHPRTRTLAGHRSSPRSPATTDQQGGQEPDYTSIDSLLDRDGPAEADVVVALPEDAYETPAVLSSEATTADGSHVVTSTAQEYPNQAAVAYPSDSTEFIASDPRPYPALAAEATTQAPRRSKNNVAFRAGRLIASSAMLVPLFAELGLQRLRRRPDRPTAVQTSAAPISAAATIGQSYHQQATVTPPETPMSNQSTGVGETTVTSEQPGFYRQNRKRIIGAVALLAVIGAGSFFGVETSSHDGTPARAGHRPVAAAPQPHRSRTFTPDHRHFRSIVPAAVSALSSGGGPSGQATIPAPGVSELIVHSNDGIIRLVQQQAAIDHHPITERQAETIAYTIDQQHGRNVVTTPTYYSGHAVRVALATGLPDNQTHWGAGVGNEVNQLINAS